MKEEAYKFLKEHKGYLKKSPKVIQERFINLGIIIFIDDIKKIVKEVKRDIKLNESIKDHKIAGKINLVKDIPKGMKVKSMWTMSNGTIGYSYKAEDESIEEKNDIIETLQKIIEDGVTPFGVRASKASKERMLSIFSSDKHIGAMTARNSIYSNDYDRDEVFSRHEKLVKNILDEHDTFGQFKKLVFYDLGDALDGANGQTTRGGHQLPQNMDSREQIDTFIEVTIKTMETLINADISEEIWFIATSQDNHSGAVGHGAVRAIQMYLQAKYPQIKTLVTAKILEHITFGDHTYIFGHGKDDSDMKFGMPVVLNDKTEGFINDYIDRKRIRSKYIHVVTGDLHQSAETFGKRFRYKKVMSMYGSSKWIHTNFGSGEAGVDYEVSDLYSPKIYKSRMTYGHDS